MDYSKKTQQIVAEVNQGASGSRLNFPSCDYMFPSFPQISVFTVEQKRMCSRCAECLKESVRKLKSAGVFVSSYISHFFFFPYWTLEPMVLALITTSAENKKNNFCLTICSSLSLNHSFSLFAFLSLSRAAWMNPILTSQPLDRFLLGIVASGFCKAPPQWCSNCLFLLWFICCASLYLSLQFKALGGGGAWGGRSLYIFFPFLEISVRRSSLRAAQIQTAIILPSDDPRSPTEPTQNGANRRKTAIKDWEKKSKEFSFFDLV